MNTWGLEGGISGNPGSGSHRPGSGTSTRGSHCTGPGGRARRHAAVRRGAQSTTREGKSGRVGTPENYKRRPAQGPVEKVATVGTSSSVCPTGSPRSPTRRPRTRQRGPGGPALGGRTVARTCASAARKHGPQPGRHRPVAALGAGEDAAGRGGRQPREGGGCCENETEQNVQPPSPQRSRAGAGPRGVGTRSPDTVHEGGWPLHPPSPSGRHPDAVSERVWGHAPRAPLSHTGSRPSPGWAAESADGNDSP